MGTNPPEDVGMPFDDKGHPVRFGHPGLPDIAALGIAVTFHLFGLEERGTNEYPLPLPVPASAMIRATTRPDQHR